MSGAYRNDDPDTAVEAAIGVDTAQLEQLVLDSLIADGPATTEELQDRMGLRLVTVSPRMRPLVRKGRVKQTEERRINRSGRSAIVWEAITT